MSKVKFLANDELAVLLKAIRLAGEDEVESVEININAFIDKGFKTAHCSGIVIGAGVPAKVIKTKK